MATPDTTVVAPAPGTPEYDAAMAAKYDSQSTPATPAVETPATPAAVERPAYLPEKFWDPKAEDPIAAGMQKMAASYAELERARSAKPAEKPAAPAVETPAPGKDGLKIDTPPAAGDNAAQSAVEAAGLNFETLNTEFVETGTLKPESYAAFEKIGLPKAYVDNYIEGQKAIARVAQLDGEAFTAAAHEAAGGTESYKQMTAWAKANMSPAEQTAYNDAVTSGSKETMAMAVSALRTKYVAANGDAPKLLSGNAAAVSEGYASRAEMTRDMKAKDAQGHTMYETDAAYRAKVMAKIAATSAF